MLPISFHKTQELLHHHGKGEEKERSKIKYTSSTYGQIFSSWRLSQVTCKMFDKMLDPELGSWMKREALILTQLLAL